MSRKLKTYNLTSATTTTMATGSAGITGAGSVRFYNESANDATVIIKVSDSSGGAGEVVIASRVLSQGETSSFPGDINLETGDMLKLTNEGTAPSLNIVHSYVDNS